MCGICGILEKRDRSPDPDELARMMDCLAHRGPDDHGLRVDGSVALGQRRLSIIDLSSAGRQPMCNEDGSVWIVYNGEFYTYADHVPELKRKGHVFRSQTDTEVILHLYEEFGLPETLRRMVGMFAFLLWDKKKNVQYLVRDRLGIKPLYYFEGDGRLAFASEIKAFYPLRDFKPRLREDTFSQYFFFARTTGAGTLLEGVSEVQPGTYVEISEGRLSRHGYYDLSRVRTRHGLQEEEALEEFDALLAQSIRRRLVSDVPVGIFLSGGVDSTILALKTTEVVGGPINTISVAYPEEAGNEFFWSDQVAARIRSRHSKSEVSSEDFFRIFPWITYIYDEPVTTGAAFYKAAKVAKESCTVMLCGQGSDEVFGGYSRYLHASRQVRINRALGAFLPSRLLDLLSGQLPRLGRGKFFRKVCARLNLSPSEVAATYAGGLSREDCLRMLEGGSDDLFRAQLRQVSAGFPARRDFLNDMLEMEMGGGLQEILQQTDRMTMAAAVETRVPFLDHELVEFAFSLPPRLKVRNGVGKYLLKRWLLRHFPPSFVMRPKMGFPTPVFQWFMDPYNPIHALIRDGLASEIGDRFNRAYIKQFIDSARQGRFGRTADVLDPLLRFVSFTVWWKTVREPKWALAHRPLEAAPERLRAPCAIEPLCACFQGKAEAAPHSSLPVY